MAETAKDQRLSVLWSRYKSLANELMQVAYNEGLTRGIWGNDGQATIEWRNERQSLCERFADVEAAIDKDIPGLDWVWEALPIPEPQEAAVEMETEDA